MNASIMKEFNEYCNTTSSKVGITLVGILELVMGIFALSMGGTAAALIGMFFSGMGMMMLWLSFTSGKNQKKFIEQLEQEGKLGIVLKDFSSATFCLNGNLKLGAYYVYCKNSRPVSYEQIGNAYQQINKTNGAETNRFLILKDGQGRQIATAKLQLKGKSDQELGAVMAYLKQRNPGVYLGCR